MAPSSTADLELTITAVGDGHELRLRLRRPHEGADIQRGPFPVALNRQKLLENANTPPEYGAVLRDMLITDPAAAATFKSMRAAAVGNREMLRVRLHLPPDLHTIRWETLLDPESRRSLALDSYLLLSRYLSADDYAPLQLRPKDTLRALIAIAAPADAVKHGLSLIDTGIETAPVTAALAAFQPTIIDATWVSLDQALRAGCDILYLVAHGTFQNGQPWLYLVDSQGNADRRPGSVLADLLRGLGDRRPRLIVLASCESAGDGYAESLAALGPLLAQAGIPAVLAMQGKLSIATNATFTPTFFRELLIDGAIDRAANSARQAVADEHDWWMPVLYTRLINGRIWEEAEPLSLPASRSARIFLSYKRNAEPDESLALRLETALRQIGHRVFRDQHMIVGTSWATEIAEQIEQSDAVIVLLSRQSIDSEMIVKEVEHAYEVHRRNGQARLLPIRVTYTGQLPYKLRLLLDQLQYSLWRNPADDIALLAELKQAIDNLANLPSPHLADPAAFGEPPTPLPYADPAFIEILEEPGGAIEASSTFYIEREGDALLRRQLNRDGGTITTIRAPRQTGKSSLLYAGVSQAISRGRQIVIVDLQSFESATLASLDTLLRSVARTVSRRLRFSPELVDRAWQSSLGPSDKLTYLFEDDILPVVNGGLLLAIDEADRLLNEVYRDSFFGLLRSWYNGRTINPLWKRLNTVLAISTEPYLLIRDPTQSPFNVGLSIQLNDFNLAQVTELNARYRERLKGSELDLVFELLGGHPYLTHRALYILAINPEQSWPDFARAAVSERSPFNDHIRRIFWLLRDKPELRSALREVFSQGRCSNELAYERLVRAGLVRGTNAQRCAPRCRLYVEMLGDLL